MRMNRQQCKKLIASSVILAPQLAFAGGFQLNTQSNAGLGRAFSGDAVIADNASAMARNPATMTLFKDMVLSVGFVSLTSMVEVKDATYTRDLYRGDALLGSSSAEANYDDAGDLAIAPNIHLIVPVNDAFSWGINAYTNFGTKTEYRDDYVAAEFGGLTDVKSINFGLSGAYRIDEQWSIGLGLDIVAAQGKMKRSINPTQTQLLAVDAKGWDVGVNMGVVYELNHNHRFGLSYRYSPELEAQGDVDFAGYPAAAGAIDDTVIIPLPDLAEFSGFHRLEQSPFAVHYSIQWIGWSDFKDLNAETSGTLNQYDWKNGWHFSVGGTYNLNSDWTLRAGYMFDTSAQDNITSISVPDSNRQYFSTGFTYQLDSVSAVDFGLTYLLGKDVNVVETKPVIPVDPAMGTYLTTSITGVTHANALLVGMNYNRTF